MRFRGVWSRGQTACLGICKAFFFHSLIHGVRVTKLEGVLGEIPFPQQRDCSMEHDSGDDDDDDDGAITYPCSTEHQHLIHRLALPLFALLLTSDHVVGQ